MGKSVCVLGAGIVGLSTARCIREEVPDARITIVTDKFNEDTVSFVAGATINVPSSMQAYYPAGVIREWMAESQRYYRKILNSEEALLAGVSEVPFYQLASSSESFSKNPLMDEFSKVSRKCSEEEIEMFGNTKYGSYRHSLTVDPKYFLPWIMKRLKNDGIKVVQRHISSLKELEGEFDVVVNCTGLMAKFLCNDDKVVPIRGQAFKVKAPWIKQVVYSDTDTYIIPGGNRRFYWSYETRIKGRLSFQDEWLAADYVCMCSRSSGHTDKPRKIVHHYGHGGYGWALCPGSAKKATELVKQVLYTPTMYSKL